MLKFNPLWADGFLTAVEFDIITSPLQRGRTRYLMDSTGFQRTLRSTVCSSTLVANWNNKIPGALDWIELDWSLSISLLLLLDFLRRPGRWNDKRDTKTPKAERPEMIKPTVTIWVPYFTSWMPPRSLCRTTNFFLGKDVYLDYLKCYEEFHGPNQSDLGVELNG